MTADPVVRRWLGAVFVTGVLLALLVHLTDRAAFLAMAGQVSWRTLIAGLLLLQAEGLATSLRLRELARPGTGLRVCLAVTGRWVAALAVLPARLGEIYGLHMMTLRLAQPLGQSLNHLFVQRLFDVLVLVMLGLPVVAVAGARLGQTHAFALLLALGLVITLVVLRLPWCFALLARIGYARRRQRYGRTFVKGALQGRRSARRTLVGYQPLRLVAITAAKWLCNIAGIALLLRAVLPALPFAPASLLAIASNLAAVIPLSGLGGVGPGDAAFVGGLAWYGIAGATAAAAALCIRALLVTAPLLFCVGVLASEALWPLTADHASPSAADAR